MTPEPPKARNNVLFLCGTDSDNLSFFGGGGVIASLPFPGQTDHCHFGAEHKAQLQGPVHLLGAQLQAA